MQYLCCVVAHSFHIPNLHPPTTLHSSSFTIGRTFLLLLSGAPFQLVSDASSYYGTHPSSVQCVFLYLIPLAFSDIRASQAPAMYTYAHNPALVSKQYLCFVVAHSFHIPNLHPPTTLHSSSLTIGRTFLLLLSGAPLQSVSDASLYLGTHPSLVQCVFLYLDVVHTLRFWFSPSFAFSDTRASQAPAMYTRATLLSFQSSTCALS